MCLRLQIVFHAWVAHGFHQLEAHRLFKLEGFGKSSAPSIHFLDECVKIKIEKYKEESRAFV